MKFVWDKKRKLLFFINKLLPFKASSILISLG